MRAMIRLAARLSALVLSAWGMGCEFVPAERPRTGFIVAEDVNLSNVEEFEAQLRNDIPVGTSKDEVEAYLQRTGMHYAFVPGFGYFDPLEDPFPPLHTHFHAGIDEIGSTLLEPLSLPVPVHFEVFIYLAADETVGRIEFSQVIMGP